MEKDLVNRLTEYSKSDYYPFHMPGHKRRELWGNAGEGFPPPYQLDITEISGFDNLHHPEGILKESMEWAAGVYGAEQSYYLVNGSTCGILSAVSAVTNCGGTVLMARNCHKSAYHAAIINRLETEYLYPANMGALGIPGAIRPEDVDTALKENGKNGQKIRAVLLVSPTYEGIVSDVERIAEIVHRWDIPLIVDEAHGAHFSFSGAAGRHTTGFPRSAINCGADIVIQSLHKTLPAFTQTAILHVRSKYVDVKKLERFLSVYQSSSPSYIFLAGIERCIRYMDGDGRLALERHAARMRGLLDELGSMKALRVLGRPLANEGFAYDIDLSKITVFTSGAGNLGGGGLFRLLRDKYHLELEMYGPGHIVAMTSLMDTDDGLERLKNALVEIDCGAVSTRENMDAAGRGGGNSGLRQEPAQIMEGNFTLRPGYVQKKILSLAEAVERPGVSVPLSESAGRISQEFLYLYPPGIPILAPGEEITGEIISEAQSCREKGMPVQGLEDPSLSMILTVAEKR